MISFLFDRIVQGENRRQLFIFNANVAARFFQQVLVRVSQQHDRLFGMIDNFSRRDKAGR